MTATVTIDSNGGISLPAAFLEKFRLKPGAKLRADLNDEGMELRPGEEAATTAAQLVDRDGFFVFAGTQPFDAVEAIMAARADREESLTPPRAQ